MTAPATEELSPLQRWSPALAAPYVLAMARLRRAMAEFVLRQFRLGESWRDRDADRFVRAVVPRVTAAQLTVSSLTSGFLDRMASEMTGTHAPPVGLPSSEITGSALRAGVDPDVVYRRPYTQVWTDLAAGTPLDEALQAAERRATSIVLTDLQLAKTHTAHKVMQADERVVGYRRVPQGTYTCALCLILSTRRYRKGNLAEVHPGCDCDVEIIVGEFDPGPVLDDDFLNAVHDAIERDLGEKYVSRSGKKGSTRARELDYRDIVIVHQHGELGPIVGVRGHHFTGPDEIKRLTHQRIED